MKIIQPTNIISIALLTLLSLPSGEAGWVNGASARENIGGSGIAPNNNQAKSVMAGCINATAQADLDINNVRAKILNGGDMWWDLFGNNEARYAVPKPPVGQVGPSSQFASSIWVGGYDAGGSLKSAAQTYRQFGGNDYWPGPLTSTATITPSTCIAWDKFYKINRADVETYYNWAVSQSGQNPLLGTAAMEVINNWPAYGPEGQPLAPYFDVNADGFYDPSSGDVPDFDITGTRGCSAQLYGDQCLFWVFNDKGNVHTETGGASIGLEIQAQAFAFATNDELNNATFYKYKIINKSSFRLDSTFFGVWDDADLGWYKDDYVGCDVNLGFGILYNGVAVDGTGQATAYGANPPAVGIDFFEGPFADPDGLDNAVTSVPSSFLNYGDNIADNERLGMCKFMYFNNNANPVNGNPTAGDDFYQYLTGTWRNGTPITYGGDGTTGSVPCNYMFPGLTDPSGFGVGGDLNNPITMPNWDEVSENNVPDDRRFLQSAGPFTLQPGAVNVITIGVPWARATQGGPLASVALLRGADSKAQLLFNNCFATLNGPTAPNLAIQELDKELILTWSNPSTSNNFNEAYHEDYDKQDPNNAEYLFQGYQVYQLKNGFVSQTDLGNIDKARLVLQCDKVDAVSQIVNYTNDVTLSALVPTEMVNGSNKGIRHSISVKEDLFATDNKNLVNHKTYYYAIIAYGHSTTIVPNFSSLQDYKPYIAGRKNADFPVFTPHTGIPHIPSPESGGLEQQSNYGNGPKLTRIEGTGNGGNILDFTSGTVSAILADPASRAKNPTYENGAGPVTIQVVDPLNVPSETNFRFILKSTTTAITTAAEWDLINLTTGVTVSSDTSIAIPNEQLINGQPVGLNTVIPKWGLSVNVFFVNSPGFIIQGPPAVYPENNSFLEATMTFDDPSKAWLTGISDQDGESNFNWIRSGTTTFTGPSAVYNDYVGVDDIQAYEKVMEGTWAPYRLCGSTPTTTPNPIVYSGGPAWGGFITLNQLKNTSSVDVVMTSDQSKWTRCPVLELQEETALAIGGAKKLHMRSSLSVDKNGLNSSQSGYNASEGDLNGTTGMGWFPGYALNLETGERLNMAFGEDSWLATENGADMKWNPSSNTMTSLGDAILFGGKHYIYVFGHYGDASYTGDAQMGNGLSDVPRYDGGKTVHDLLAAAAATSTTVSDGYKRNVFSDVMWVNIPMLNQGRTVLETDVKIRLRVTRAYSKYGTGEQVPSGSLVVGENYFVEYGPVVHNGISRAIGTTFVAADASWTSTVANPSVLSTVNKADPIYEFNTSDIGTRKEESVAAVDALSLINIVPNPYYAYSGYEEKTSDNIVKITNLPRNCTVSIYTLNGTLIRTLTKADDDIKASLDWDMKNQARIPIASGMYIIHVDVPNVGEKILKWFGVMRPLDLEAY
ncbi:MAG: hypothetical protein Q7W13_04205 [Bacteroidia bacterium]|nr:hypothetical protein [Bacteroidia bacterium]